MRSMELLELEEFLLLRDNILLLLLSSLNLSKENLSFFTRSNSYVGVVEKISQGLVLLKSLMVISYQYNIGK
jgi:hypothetical protein